MLALWHLLAVLSTAPSARDDNPCVGDVGSHELAPRLLKGATQWHVCTGMILASVYTFDDARCRARFQKFLPDGGLLEDGSYSYGPHRTQRGRCVRERVSQGRPIGLQRDYFENGQLHHEQDWGDGGTMVSRTWDEAGQLRVQSVRASPAAEVLTLSGWNAAGTLIEEQQLKVGTMVPEGRTRRWNDGGMLTLDAWFRDGIPLQHCRPGHKAKVFWEVGRGLGLGRYPPRQWRSECADNQGRRVGWAFGAVDPDLVYAREYAGGAPTGAASCWRDEEGSFVSGRLPLSVDAGTSLEPVEATRCFPERGRP